MSKKQALKSVIAKRYAAALLELAAENKIQHEVRNELVQIDHIIKTSRDMQTALTSKIIDKNSFSNAITEIFKKAKISDLVIKFCKVMVKNSRVALLQDTVEAYKDLLAESEGEVKVLVTTAAPIAKKQLDAISSTVQALTKKKAIIKEKVDNKILGGVVINIGSRMIDGSVNGKLERLRIAQKSSAG